MGTATRRRARRQSAIVPRLYRLATFDLVDDSEPLEYVGRRLGRSARDDRYAREAIEQYNAYVVNVRGCTLAMGLFKIG
jgi:hypothetical protein